MTSSVFQRGDSAKQPVPIVQPKPRGQIFAKRGLIEWKIVDSFPRVSTLVFRKCQKLRLSSISFCNQSKIIRYINHFSKRELSVCVLLSVKVNWSKNCWKSYFLLWLFGVSSCQTKKKLTSSFFTFSIRPSPKLPVFSCDSHSHNRLVCSSWGLVHQEEKVVRICPQTF